MNPIEELLRGHIRSVREAGEEYERRIVALEKVVGRLTNGPKWVAPKSSRKKAGSARVWAPEEDDLLRVHYPSVGAVGCTELLPHRTADAIHQRAHRLGVQCAEYSERLNCMQCDARVSRSQIAACQSPFCSAKKMVAGERTN